MSNPYNTFHIHIKGIVQGVGFRPFVYKLAKELGLSGWVNNTTDGVHIFFNADLHEADDFLIKIQNEKPSIAIITDISIQEIPNKKFHTFEILHSEEIGEKNLLATPDYSMCAECEKEIFNPESRRYYYAFESCTNCGPRYSIIKKLPYDRNKTTMDCFRMCPVCEKEYNDPLNRRYYHQTNSCPHCPVEMALFEKNKWLKFDSQNQIIDHIIDSWKEGKIVAIKGIGGYLITCDAANKESIIRLRQLKNRPTKPFALMYHNIFELAEDVELDISAAEELKSISAPIVLLSVKEDRWTSLEMQEIAPNLGQLGVMLPYTPLYKLLMQKYQKPIVATSGNKSGSTIIYEDKNALKTLDEICDLIVLNNRDIVIPQDDSVVKFTTVKRNRIIIRRSRGLAPSFLPNLELRLPEETVLCMGASLKSTFTLLHKKNIFISQYLGDTEDIQAQENYGNTLNHLMNLMDIRPDHIVTDTHPNYFSSQFGMELADNFEISASKIQHHEAHFWAVLAENDLLKEEAVLGVIWDGTGLGNDGHIWGGEFFTYSQYGITRTDHLDYFNFILGDKMPREPRISALAIMGHHKFLKTKFTIEEWKIYGKILANNQLKTSSAGRLFDGAACIILGNNHQSYEGEAAMQLENCAYKYFKKYGITTFYSYLDEDFIPTNFPHYLLNNLILDYNKGFDPEFLAAKFHITLAHYINNQIRKTGIRKIAFSGGVFQNGWLVDLLQLFLEPEYKLYFHKNLSPNDEGVSFGQLIGHLFQKSTLQNKFNQV